MCNRRATCWVWVTSLVIVLATPTVSVAGSGAEMNLPAGVSSDWWSQVQRSIVLEEYGILAQGTAGTGFRAANPAQRFDMYFDSRGVRVAPMDEPTWELGLSLTAWGRPETLEPIAGAWLTMDEDRVELDRGPITEWFVNRPDGLEHGFTIPVRPRGDGGRVVFDLALSGGLRPVFSIDGQAIDFYSSGNVAVLRYAKLVVTDAVGSAVPARMEPIEGGIRIAVEDSDAVYPITVDPLATSPAWTAVGEAVDDRFGHSVSTAGDVNGDGYSDVVVGAFRHTSSAGKVYLYLGGVGGPSAAASWTAVGESANSNFGRSVATAGDVNGDGYSDVVIGADGHSTSTGKAYLYLGYAGGLSAAAAWTAVGYDEGDVFGQCVATAGDVNGDGYSDVIVGAPGSIYSRGVSNLYLGGASGLSATESWVRTGDSDASYFGFSVATAGDVNGDGYSDVVIGAYGYASNTGRAYLYFGGPGGLVGGEIWSASGEGATQEYASSVATAGDVNGDGYSDVIVGAHRGGGGGTGKVYVYLGGVGGLPANASWTAVGESAYDSFGYPVSTAGDVNGDGYADVVVGAMSRDGSRGKTYLYLGAATGLPVSWSWAATGIGNGNEFGASVGTAGDVNGDGYSDVVVGARGYASYTGMVLLYLGGSNGLSTGSSRTAVGEASSDRFGFSAASAGDTNGDGYADVVVGAYGKNSFTGKAYLYLGGASGLSATASWNAVAEAPADRFGASVGTAGDVNGDGYSDVVVGAIYGGSNDAGRTYLYLGSATGLSMNATWTATGEQTNAYFGYPVATAGDVNGDGYSDVVVGAYSYNNGKAYLYLGGAGGLSSSPSWTAVAEPRVNFGAAVATAGDVNVDGYSDVVIGDYAYNAYAGKAYLYLGGPGGLSPSPSWTAVGEAPSSGFAFSVSSAGDVNGDGCSDVLIGADGYAGGFGKAYLYLGGPSELSPTASWTATGEAANNYFGRSVSSTGDVNGDGYSDVIVGAEGHNGSTGKAYLYLGGASGLSTSASWTAIGQAASNNFGRSVASAGDVNGNGLADVIVGAPGYSSLTGKVYVYQGGADGAGVAVVPRQLRATSAVPISLGGAAYEQEFRLGLKLRSPAGRVSRMLQWQVVPWGTKFDPRVTEIRADSDWYDTAVIRTVPVSLSEDLVRYVWRARVRYHPANSPFVPWSPWFTMTGNALREADLFSTSAAPPPPCTIPDEELYITTVTLDINGNPVLHYQDPNQPADVTGYNIYRAPASTGPWTKIASNVVDMDEGTPNKQYVDKTGGGGATWYYEVSAFNGACGAEGPR